MIYLFIENHKKEFEILRMCLVLGVNKSAYYAWRKRPESSRLKENIRLVEVVKEVFDEHRKIYGSPRITAYLRMKGYHYGHNRIAKLMKENLLMAKVRRKFRYCGKNENQEPEIENKLNRQFNPSEPNKAWVTDITYIWTRTGWLYLCVFIDLYSRKVVGWSMSKQIDATLVIRALGMACFHRKPEKGLMIHSDQGVQYTSKAFKEELREREFIQSMSRRGNCWDNACAESFFSSLKNEELHFYNLDNQEDAKVIVFRYIEMFYNRTRLHSYLGYKSPASFEG
jgi:putative transposase